MPNTHSNSTAVPSPSRTPSPTADCRLPTAADRPPPTAPASPTSDIRHPTSDIPRPDYLLSLYLDHGLTIADIAFTINRSLEETLALLEAPDFIALTHKYAAAQTNRGVILAQCSSETVAGR